MKNSILSLVWGGILMLPPVLVFAFEVENSSGGKAVEQAPSKSVAAANEPQQSQIKAQEEELRLMPINASDYLKEGVGCGLPSFDSNAK